MAGKKKNLYEILEVSCAATIQEISAAYQEQQEKLLAAQGALEHADFEYQRQLLKLALDTLGDPFLREEYDEKQKAQQTPGAIASTSDSIIPLSLEPEKLTTRAEALSLRAEALALRADVMSIRTDPVLSGSYSQKTSLFSRAVDGLGSSVRVVVVVLGTLAVLGAITQSVFVFYTLQKRESAAVAAAKAEEQMVIQEYYRKYGVRPASAAEARLLEQERQREEREAREEERRKQKEESDARRFEEESRRLGEQVSYDLRRAEERQRREEERKEEEKRRQAAEKEAEIQRERDKWRRVLSR